jgi:hypothetical protein
MENPKDDRTTRDAETCWENSMKAGAKLAQVRGDKRQFDIIVLATGFGGERDSTKHHDSLLLAK